MANDERTETLLSHEAAPGRAWSDALPPGFGRYRVLARLGAGGMGVVYEGHDPKLHRTVAIKVGLRSRAHDTERFVREARAMAALQHPNVVALYDFGFENDTPYLVLERVRAESLGELFGHLEPARRRAALLEAGEGLRAAHRAGIVHRDVKPDNILIGHGGRARLTDFGLAAFEAAHTDTVPSSRTARTAAGVGTLAYMSPEQHIGDPATVCSDVYAFCVSVVEVLGGRRPFVGRSAAELLTAKRKGAPRVLLQGLPRRLRSVLRRGLEPDPHARSVQLEEVLRALASRSQAGPVLQSVLATAAIASTALAIATPTKAAPCSAKAPPHWTSRDRDTVRTRLPALGERVAEALDTWNTAWNTAYADACGKDPPRRKAEHQCLADQAHAFDLTRARIVSAALTGRQAIDSASALPSPETCSELHEALSPSDRAFAREVRRIEDLASEARRQGNLARAADLLLRVLPTARAVEHDETRARLTAHLGDALAISGAPTQGRDALSLALAEPNQPPRLEAASALAMAWIEALDLEDLDAGFRWLAHAQAINTRAPLPLHLQGKLLSHEAALLKQKGEFEASRAVLERARALLDTPDADDRTRRRSMTVEFNLGAINYSLQRFSEAAEAFERSAALAAQEFGAGHPEVAKALVAAFRCHVEGGALEPAEHAIGRAIEIYVDARGEDHPSLASVYRYRAELGYAKSDVDDAVAYLRKAVAVLPREQLPRLAYEADLATALFDQGALDESMVLAESVIATTEEATDPEFTAARASALRCLAEVHRAQGNLHEALQAIRRAAAAAAGTYVGEHNKWIFLATEAELLLAMDDRKAAVALLAPHAQAAREDGSTASQAALDLLAQARGQSNTTGTSGSSK